MGLREKIREQLIKFNEKFDESIIDVIEKNLNIIKANRYDLTGDSIVKDNLAIYVEAGGNKKTFYETIRNNEIYRKMREQHIHNIDEYVQDLSEAIAYDDINNYDFSVYSQSLHESELNEDLNIESDKTTDDYYDEIMENIGKVSVKPNSEKPENLNESFDFSDMQGIF